MEFLYDLGLFTAKTVLIVGAILVVLIFLLQAGASRRAHRPQIEVEKLNTRFKSLRRHLQSHLLEKKAFKALVKSEKKTDKEQQQPRSSRLFVVDFDGDVRATPVASLREEVTAILSVGKPGDEVVVRLESGGGLVTSYGLAASQLARLKSAGLRLTVTVDKIAASGGYMMACVADKIVAAPFAVVGSIGVVAQLPNVNRLLKKHDIDYKEVTAGEYKRTVSVFGEITEPGMEKFKTQIEETHVLFKTFVATHRPKVDIAKVATGEYWYGTQALDLALVDELVTSDDYLYRHFDMADVYRIHYHPKKKLMEKLTDSAASALEKATYRILGNLDRKRTEI